MRLALLKIDDADVDEVDTDLLCAREHVVKVLDNVEAGEGLALVHLLHVNSVGDHGVDQLARVV